MRNRSFVLSKRSFRRWACGAGSRLRRLNSGEEAAGQQASQRFRLKVSKVYASRIDTSFHRLSHDFLVKKPGLCARRSMNQTGAGTE